MCSSSIQAVCGKLATLTPTSWAGQSANASSKLICAPPPFNKWSRWSQRDWSTGAGRAAGFFFDCGLGDVLLALFTIPIPLYEGSCRIEKSKHDWLSVNGSAWTGPFGSAQGRLRSVTTRASDHRLTTDSASGFRFPVLRLCTPFRCRAPGGAWAVLLWHRKRKFRLLGFRDSTSASGWPDAPCARSRWLVSTREIPPALPGCGLPSIGTWCVPHQRWENRTDPQGRRRQRGIKRCCPAAGRLVRTSARLWRAPGQSCGRIRATAATRERVCRAAHEWRRPSRTPFSPRRRRARPPSAALTIRHASPEKFRPAPPRRDTRRRYSRESRVPDTSSSRSIRSREISDRDGDLPRSGAF